MGQTGHDSANKHLSDLLALYPKSEKIPNFEKLRPFLLSTFVDEAGPAQGLILHYYISGFRHPAEFLHDPAEQARWCRNNLPYFAKTAKALRTLRNKLAHRELVTTTMISNAAMSIIALRNSETKASCLLDVLIDRLVTISLAIVTPTFVPDSSTCPLCASKLPVDLTSGQKLLLADFDSFQRKRLSSSLTGPPSLADTTPVPFSVFPPPKPEITHSGHQATSVSLAQGGMPPQGIPQAGIPPLDNPAHEGIPQEQSTTAIHTLRQLKGTMPQTLKGSLLMVQDGKYAGTRAVFRSWSGTVAYLELEGIGRTAVRIDTAVSLL